MTSFSINACPIEDLAFAGATSPKRADKPTGDWVREGLEHFAELVTRHLGAAESHRLSSQVLESFDRQRDVRHAFEEGVINDEGRRLSQWLLVHLDWNASVKIEWQIGELLANFGLDGQWPWPQDGARPRTASGDIKDLSAWLRRLGFALLTIDGDDGPRALLLRTFDLDTTLILATVAGLSVSVAR